MQRRAPVAVAIILWTSICFAGSGEGTDSELPLFRISTGEVHINIAASDKHNFPVRDLAIDEFTILRDGHPINREEVVWFGKVHQMPISAFVLTDVSDSMLPGLSLEREAAQWLRSNTNPAEDRLTLFDFGSEVQPDGQSHERIEHLTSLFDAAVQIIPRIAAESGGLRRRVLILLTDGNDNFSRHSQEDVIEMALKYDVAIYAITAHRSKKQCIQQNILLRITAESGGQFYEIRNTRELQRSMSSMNEQLRNGFELVLHPNTRDTGVHRLFIESHTNLHFVYRTGYFQHGGEILIATSH
jgi:hypothetical protein